MTIVNGYIANIIDGMYGPTNNRQKEALELVENRVRLTEGLVSDLLNLSRIEAGRFFIDREPVDLSRVVPEEIEQLKMKADELGVKLEYTAPTQPIPILQIDPPKTRQVIMNLIDNAIAYSPKGIVKITLESAGNQVVFKVKDNGIGVPEAERPKLFNKFYRATNAKQQRADGTGIGLYLVKRVIEQQGGAIIFDSQAGKGSIFGFRLPLSADAPKSTPARPRNPTNTVASQSEHISVTPPTQIITEHVRHTSASRQIPINQ